MIEKVSYQSKPKVVEHISLREKSTMVVSALKENKRFVIFLLAAALLAESNQTITVFLSQLQYVHSGISPQYMGYIYILVTVSGLLSAYTYRLTSWLGEDLFARLMFLMAGVACVAMAIWASPIISICGIIVFRSSASLFLPVRMDIENRHVTIADRATILSIYSVIMNMMAIGTNLILGRIADISVAYAMVTGAIFCFSGLMIYSLWKFRNE